MRYIFALTIPLFLAILASACAHTSTAPGVVQNLIPVGKYARRMPRPLHPSYITIHSTDNTSSGANARNHSLNLQAGRSKGPHNAIGYVSWHFTVDQDSIYQSLPTNERGEHADYDGPGNQSSIGIEMCVNRGANAQTTIKRTAKLTAWLMNQYGIGLSHVVPHQHWRQIRHDDHKDLGFKACPKLLLEHGQLGPKWNAFLSQVESFR